MSKFEIFTVVLIILYLAYYAIVIIRDLYGKKDKSVSAEEVYDISTINDEEKAVKIEEVPDTDQPGESEQKEAKGENRKKEDIDQQIARIQNKLEIIDPQGLSGISPKTFREILSKADREGSLFLDVRRESA